MADPIAVLQQIISLAQSALPSGASSTAPQSKTLTGFLIGIQPKLVNPFNQGTLLTIFPDGGTSPATVWFSNGANMISGVVFDPSTLPAVGSKVSIVYYPGGGASGSDAFVSASAA